MATASASRRRGQGAVCSPSPLRKRYSTDGMALSRYQGLPERAIGTADSSGPVSASRQHGTASLAILGAMSGQSAATGSLSRRALHAGAGAVRLGWLGLLAVWLGG